MPRAASVAGRIAWGENPFASLGNAWCRRCRQAVDTDTAAAHRAGVFTYRRWCLRCGRIVACGAYAAPLVAGGGGLPPSVVEFVRRPGEASAHRAWSGVVLDQPGVGRE